MRLINTWSLKLEQFFGDYIPAYAILSHTWGADEVSLQEWLVDHSTIAAKQGCIKIIRACELARSHGHIYLWVDTNCIDKTSSAELSEAINSMFRWYRSADVCYAYLADLPDLSFPHSRWFSRGWTLQELLAPGRIEFYDGDWTYRGNRDTLAEQISQATGISTSFLSFKYTGERYLTNEKGQFVVHEILNARPLDSASIATRMSWLANRRTTRVEDMAYCMLGIFDINMPLLYGEGIRAFQRLQEEILKNSDDHSIFCWTWDWRVPRAGLLAHSASDFRNAASYRPSTDKKMGEKPSPFAMTNSGLHIHLPILNCWKSFLAIMDANELPPTVPTLSFNRYYNRERPWQVGIHIAGDKETSRMSRQRFPFVPVPLAKVPLPEKRQELFISQRHDDPARTLERNRLFASLAGPTTGDIPEPTNMENAAPGISGYGSFALLTLEPRQEVYSIQTYPPRRFSPDQSYIKVIDGGYDTSWGFQDFPESFWAFERPSRGSNAKPSVGFRRHRKRDDGTDTSQWVACEAVLVLFSGLGGKQVLLLLGMSMGHIIRPPWQFSKTYNRWILPSDIGSSVALHIRYAFDDSEQSTAQEVNEATFPTDLSEFVMPIVDEWLEDSENQLNERTEVLRNDQLKRMGSELNERIRWDIVKEIEMVMAGADQEAEVPSREDLQVFTSDTSTIEDAVALNHVHVVLQGDLWSKMLYTWRSKWQENTP
ncbi:heterokaryon incompatibility protein-domain-containing protein [Echria macrotheca]|uniref:Heterokaryon incompatibility protein-domain-containing protein n=1 Tax=Echria macrotheca TaxID=438768 RepID=A0AAJ0FA81_9PEZI|nr:heterokaryon incompatibility protein-domain-containing protein [Echria macrotheca]